MRSGLVKFSLIGLKGCTKDYIGLDWLALIWNCWESFGLVWMNMDGVGCDLVAFGFGLVMRCLLILGRLHRI